MKRPVKTGEDGGKEGAGLKKLRPKKCGTRFGRESDRVTPCPGPVRECEFDGEARGTAYGWDVPALALEGDTGMVEVRVKVSPCRESGVSFNLAAQGYTGAREEVSRAVQLNYAF